MSETIMRCWGDDDPQMAEYHDNEWGVPEHDDQKLYAKLTLDSFQAGLSWRTILHKRDNFHKAFRGFDIQKVAKFNNADRERLLADVGIIRNRQKIEAAINNAQRVLAIQKEMGSFDEYLWGFTGHKTLRSKPARDWTGLASTSPESEAMSADLKARGFKFVGGTICYAFMQAVGMVDDHLVGCFRFQER